jgi:hypothetical protein
MKISSFFFLAATVAAAASDRDDIHVLMYETDESLGYDPMSPLSFFKERSTFADLPTTVYGGGLSYEGFGDKYQTLRSILDVINPNKLVVVADARDVALNVPENEEAAKMAIDRFINTYKKLTVNDPGAVVMSAEGQCCVSAMTHAHPSEYFDPITKKRTKRACSSGKDGCHWNQNENIYAWVDFHRERAYNQTGIPRNVDPVGDVYLNAGLMAGYPADLMKLVDVLDINPKEDDQAVLSGLMYQFPEMIVLDYAQEMFGNNQWPKGLIDGCVFEKEDDGDKNADPKQSFLVHSETNAQPLIIHTPGKFYGCLDILIEELGGTSQQRYLQESPEGNPRTLKGEGFDFDAYHRQQKLDENYGAYGAYGNYGSIADDVAECGCDCTLPETESETNVDESRRGRRLGDFRGKGILSRGRNRKAKKDILPETIEIVIAMKAKKFAQSGIEKKKKESKDDKMDKVGDEEEEEMEEIEEEEVVDVEEVVEQPEVEEAQIAVDDEQQYGNYGGNYGVATGCTDICTNYCAGSYG